MSTIDPAKLKVVELRVELTNRGLDTKGNKPVLVKRLKEALEKELQKEIPDTSIVDTSTEDVNTSQESGGEEVQTDPPDKGGDSPAVAEEEETPDESKDAEVEKEEKEPPAEDEQECAEENNIEDVEKKKEPSDDAVVEENGDHEMQETEREEDAQTSVDGSEAKTTSEEQPKGEKRRRSSPSPERVQRRRSKTPIKEDEPILDNNKVQLSWYDSDLHLLVDKKSFLSGKPYHEGAFGYAWAGARATHGAKSGKVCFEVKITEELKWDDLVKQSDKKRDGHRSDSKRERQRSERESSRTDHDSSRSNNESSKSEDGSKADDEKETPEEKEKSVDENKEKSADEDKEKSVDEDKEKETAENKTDDDKEKEDKSMEVDEEKPKDEAAKETKEEDKPEEEKKPAEVEEKTENPDSIKEDPPAEEDKQENVDEKEPKDDEKKEAKPESMEVDETPIEPIAKHLFRVGWSVADSGLQLGEAKYSYGFESSGKFVTDKEFVDYGIKFGVGDVIGAYLNINESGISLTYTVNGEAQPEAANIPLADLPQEDFALFPHILTRNYSFEMNLGSREEPWFPNPADLEDYAYIDTVEDKAQGPVRPESRSECEVVMMCGLPASGKTHWVKDMVKENPDKRYTVIGNTHLLDKMTVNGNPLKNSYKGRWNVILDRLMKCVNILVETAALRRRNYVIDQTNVFPSAQRRKMRLFEGFKRRAVVVVVADEEQAKRRAQQEAQDGKDVPDSAILEMKANMSIPRRGEWLEEVSYVELGEEEAKALVQKYNQQGREAGFGPMGGQRSGYHRDNRGHPYRWDHSTSRRDYRGGYRDNRSYQNSRYDRSRQHGGWQNRRPPPGSWNRDIRRDSRGPPSGGSRDFRNNNRSSGGSGGSGGGGGGSRQIERSGSRDNRNRSQNSGNYNRNQRPQNNRNQPANWQGGSGGSGGSGSWQNQNWSGQGMWNQGGWNQGSWSGQAQQWKGSYGQGGGYGQGGYQNYPNWNYYGQYAQNWNSQGQPQTTTAGGTAASESTNAASYGQYSQQAAWAQYAQQYAQQGQPSAAAAIQPSSSQK